MHKIIIVVSLIIIPITALSHPGRTASDGCHYCRTNCDKWGVPWNVRHCHHKAEPFLQVPVKEEKPTKEKNNETTLSET